MKELGLSADNLGCYNGSDFFANGEWITTLNPATGKPIARVKEANMDDYKATLTQMKKSELAWKNTPMPKRGEIVRQLGEAFRKYKK